MTHSYRQFVDDFQEYKHNLILNGVDKNSIVCPTRILLLKKDDFRGYYNINDYLKTH